jgi:hypothetical protein
MWHACVHTKQRFGEPHVHAVLWRARLIMIVALHPPRACRLNQQLTYVQPPSEPATLPLATDVWAWVDSMLEILKGWIDNDMLE